MSSDQSLRLGQIVGTRQVLALNEQQRQFHMHIIGATGTGKTSFMETMIRQDLVENRGLCLIDPLGGLAQRILQWASHQPATIKNLYYIAPHRDDCVPLLLKLDNRAV